jgi:hypothetical protein
MGRIFISAAHGGYEGTAIDIGSAAGDTTEAKEMILLRDLVVTELRARNAEVLAVPDELSARQTIEWINTRYRSGDVSLEIHAEAYYNPTARGACVYYIANNTSRKANAELLLLGLLRRVPQLPSRGVKPDTETAFGSLLFCRSVVSPSLQMEVGYLTNPDDRYLLQNRRRDMALGIADGLVAWVNGTALPSPTPVPTPAPAPVPVPTPTPTVTTYPSCNIKINSQNYAEQGIIVSGNAFVPIDLVDSLGLDLSKTANVSRISYRNVVHLRAVELRDYNISVGWEQETRTLSLRSILNICAGQIDRIMGHGNTTEVQLMMFLKANNETALTQFPDLPKLYREEGSVEGVNYDIAFCQMCLETNFLRFGGTIKPTQNNFAGLGSVGGGPEGASFPSARVGVTAHVQHLKAYASTEPIVQEIVDPRFRFVTRGIAPLVDQLSGRWAADLAYGQKIMALVRRLYESAGIL